MKKLLCALLCLGMLFGCNSNGDTTPTLGKDVPEREANDAINEYWSEFNKQVETELSYIKTEKGIDQDNNNDYCSSYFENDNCEVIISVYTTYGYLRFFYITDKNINADGTHSKDYVNLVEEMIFQGCIGDMNKEDAIIEWYNKNVTGKCELKDVFIEKKNNTFELDKIEYEEEDYNRITNQ